MPELPEVQTVINSIQKDLINQKIIECNLFWKNVVYNTNQNQFITNIVNKIIKKIYRRGKYIIFSLNKGFMICHLRMTGSLFVDKKNHKNNHIQARFKINNNKIMYLHFKDIRKFGGFYYMEDINELNQKIGIDPFDLEFTNKWFLINVKKRKRHIKHLLLDQKLICGLGNIYIDEALWKAKIHPLSISYHINKKKLSILYKTILLLLNDSIKSHGTSIKDFEFDNMKTGTYKNKLKVYNQNGKLCYLCKSIIKKIKVAGRGTHICEQCQK